MVEKMQVRGLRSAIFSSSTSKPGDETDGRRDPLGIPRGRAVVSLGVQHGATAIRCLGSFFVGIRRNWSDADVNGKIAHDIRYDLYMNVYNIV